LNHLTIQGPPTHAGPDDIIGEEDFIDVIKTSKAPDEAYIQVLERQCLAVRDIVYGFTLETGWAYEDICYFLQCQFPFLFRYFKEGPLAGRYTTETPFLVVHKSHQTLTAIPYEPMALNGEVLRRNSMLNKKSFQLSKLYFGMFKLTVILLYAYHTAQSLGTLFLSLS
jgi:hypothetical protein